MNRSFTPANKVKGTSEAGTKVRRTWTVTQESMPWGHERRDVGLLARSDPAAQSVTP